MEEVKKILSKTKSNMKRVKTYKAEFDTSVQRYAEMRWQYEILMRQWYEEGCKITEEYTNKSGFTNQRKTALYLSLESLRKELIDMETLFGLTPKGLKVIRANGLEGKKESKLEKALRQLS